MNVRERFHRIGSVLAAVTVLLVAAVFAVLQSPLEQNGLLIIMAVTLTLATLAYGAAASVGWIVSGFTDKA